MNRNTIWIMATAGALFFGLVHANAAFAGGWTMPSVTTRTNTNLRPANPGTPTPTALTGHIACPGAMEGLMQWSLPNGWTSGKSGMDLVVHNTVVQSGFMICHYKESKVGARYDVGSASRPIPRGQSCRAVGNGFYCQPAR